MGCCLYFAAALLFTTAPTIIYGLLTSDLFQFGPPAFDAEIVQGSTCVPISIPSGYVLHGIKHNTAYVCQHGVISFDQPQTSAYPIKPPSAIASIAPFWLPALAQTCGGHVWYRLEKRGAYLSIFNTMMQNSFMITGYTFKATDVLVVTWENITFTSSCSSNMKRNTFQAILATDGTVSYSLHQYLSLNYCTQTWMFGAGPGISFDAGNGVTGTMSTASGKCSPGFESLSFATQCNTRAVYPGRNLYMVANLAGYQGFVPPDQMKLINDPYIQIFHTQVSKFLVCTITGDPHVQPFETTVGFWDPQTIPGEYALLTANCGNIDPYNPFTLWYQTRSVGTAPGTCTGGGPSVMNQFMLEYYFSPDGLNFDQYQYRATTANWIVQRRISQYLGNGHASQWTSWESLSSGVDPGTDVTITYGSQLVILDFNLGDMEIIFQYPFNLIVKLPQTQQTANNFMGICGTLGTQMINQCLDRQPWDRAVWNIAGGGHSCNCLNSCWNIYGVDWMALWLQTRNQNSHLCPIQNVCGAGKRRRKRTLDSYCNANSQQWASQQCAPITNPSGPFQACSAIASNVYSNCVMDVCTIYATGNAALAAETACNAMDVFSQSCGEYLKLNQTAISWRSPSLCPASCPPNMHFETCMSPCIPTCQNPFANVACSLPCRGGCTCNSGLLYDGTQCVMPSSCGCQTSDATFHAIGSTWVTYDCSQQCTCSISGGMPMTNCNNLPPCAPQAVCLPGNGNRTCLCNSNYFGDGFTCYVDLCASAPCANGGSCVPSIGKYSCVCAGGYTGPNCNIPMNCASNPCKNGGRCTPQGASYSCTCPQGYIGQNCEYYVDSCSSSPCLNGATCINAFTSYRCTCQNGTYGANCQNIVNHCVPNPCQNGGTCVNNINAYTCNCPQGYTGPNCQNIVNHCVPNPCQNGGTCVNSINAYTCNCPQGYTGLNCQTIINYCDSNPCQNGGTCSNHINGYTCKCPSGYDGDNCQNNLCSSSPCQNGGTCIPIKGGYSCTCAEGYTGPRCQTPINYCQSNPCMNGGTCTSSSMGYTCNCPDGFGGVNCQENFCIPNPCENDGVCQGVQNGYICHCPEGFTGKNCSSLIDHCASNPCQNGGTCADLPNAYICLCPGGYIGVNCQVNLCTPNPCQFGGTCLHTSNGITCQCTPQYTGQNCSILLTTLPPSSSAPTSSSTAGTVATTTDLWGSECCQQHIDDYEYLCPDAPNTCSTTYVLCRGGDIIPHMTCPNNLYYDYRSQDTPCVPKCLAPFCIC